MTYKEKIVIKKLIDRFCTFLDKTVICVFDNDIQFVNSLGYKKVKVIRNEERYINEIIFISYDAADKEAVNDFIKTNKERNIIIALSKNFTKKSSYSLAFINSKKRVKIYSDLLNRKIKRPPKTFKVLAIIHVYNEEDIIKKTVDYLISQGIYVYLLDNHSTDSTFNIIKSLKKIYGSKLFFESFPKNKYDNKYNWQKQLKRTEIISRSFDFDWYIHYDADEYRISPFDGVNLKDFIYYADQLGCTLIDNTLIDFKLTKNDSKTNIFMKDSYFDFNHRTGAFLQIKTWKKTKKINISDTGGHLAVVDNPKVCPFKILNRHYPLRNVEQANRKIFIDRIPRYSNKERKKGWHIQYDSIKNEKDFIFDKEYLIKWNRNTVDEYFIPLFFGIGIEFIN